MTQITWLHLSDLHIREEPGSKYNLDVVLDALLKDIQEFTVEKNLKLNFIIITGDIANKGMDKDYALANNFLDNLLHITNLTKDQLLVIPGNHDVNRPSVEDLVGLRKSLLTSEALVDLFGNNKHQEFVSKGQGNYANFVKKYFKNSLIFNSNDYFFVRHLDFDGTKLAILGLNSAWASVSDEKIGTVLVGEPQIIDAKKRLAAADITITLLHHPFEWIQNFDRRKVEKDVRIFSDFVLHGHKHEEGFSIEATFEGTVVVIPGGAAFEDRNYPNSYNFVKIDTDKKIGALYLRRYNDECKEWIRDIAATGEDFNGEYHFLLFNAHNQKPLPTRTLRHY